MHFSMAKKHSSENLPLSAETNRVPVRDGLPRASLKELRKSAGLTQHDLATTLCVGQDTISRLEKRNDLLLSTLRHYVESIGGELALVATFPDRPAVIIDHLGETAPAAGKHGRKRAVAGDEP